MSLMRSSSVLFATIATAGVTFLATREAQALGPVDLEVGAKVGAATSPVSSSNAPNPLGFGLGARGGLSFLGIYGGVQLVYYFGSSQNEAGLGQVSEHALLYGIEAGYGFTMLDKLLTIRPQVGLGNATFTVSGNTNLANASASNSNSNLYLEPGVTGLVSLGGWFVGADVNLLFLPGMDNTTTAFTLHGQVGLKF
jgi:hypothetical protein